jgi:hypothetical protein
MRNLWRQSGGPPDQPLATSTPARLPSGSSLLPPTFGSRFSCLVDVVKAEDGEVQALVEEVAWCGIEDEPFVPPVISRPDLPLEEVAADFWCKIGYPTPESRSWERSSASPGKAEVSPNIAYLMCRARSLSPTKTGRVHEGRRASSTSPVGLHLAKPPRMGAWRGPLPRRRVTPMPVLGDFMANAKLALSGGSLSSRGSGQWSTTGTSSKDRTSRLEILVIAAVAPRSSDQAGVNFEIGRCWAASADGSKVRWAGLGRAILAAKHGRVLPLPRFDIASINQLADIAAPTAAFVTPSSSPSSAPSSSTLSISHPAGHRYLAAVVADHRQHQPMAGAPPRPSSSSTTPVVTVPQGPRPAAPPVVRAQPLYAGPPGFQGGWQQGAPGAVGAPPAYRPPPVDGAGVDI